MLTIHLRAAAAPAASSGLRLAFDTPWTPKQGLPGNTVFSLLQTRDGYLWAGTAYGLARFDGIRSESFDESNTPGLKGSKVVNLFEDNQGNLWIATREEGVLLVDKQGHVTSLKETRGNVARAFAEDRGGGVWIYMVNIDLSLGQVVRYRDAKPDPELRPFLDCSAFAIDDSGLVWIAIRAGRLFGLGPTPINASAVAVPYEIPVTNVDFLLASRSGGYWRLADGHVQKWKLDHLEKDYGQYPWPANATVLAAAEDSAANLIVGTYSGGVYWLGPDAAFTHLTNLPSSYIYSLCFDREGSLWVGTDNGGLTRVRQKNFNVLDESRGSAVKSVCEDSQGGVWFAVNNGKVSCWKDHALRQYEPDGLQDPAVLADSSNRVWVGAARGLYRLEGAQFKPVEALPTDILALHEDRQGQVWFGTKSGLICWDQHKMFTNFSSTMVQAVADDRAGNVWAGTPDGLNRLRDNRVTAFHIRDGLPSEDVSALVVAHDDTLWVGTSGGLARFDGTNWTKFSRAQGLISDWVLYLVEDSNHYLWLGSPAGLMRLKIEELNQFAAGGTRTISCRPYQRDEGLPTDECSAGAQPAAWPGREGTMWFPTTMGLTFIRPDQFHPNTNEPIVRIESVKVQGDLQNSTALRAASPIAVTIPANKEGLEIDYNSLNLTAPERTLFKYRMGAEGRELPWSEPASVRVAQFPKLPAGRYRFQVTACNEDGVWNQTGATLSVTVLPPFWRTSWFITLSTLCLLGIIVGSVHYISTQRLQRQLESMRQQEALEKERARIARDLHDQLGANLTQVALLGEMVESDKDLPDEVETHARQISSTARETTHALDEIVWTVNPSNDTLDGLINYVCKYAQEYFALAGLRYRLEVPAQLPSTPITPELRHNLFLVAKEAVNNIVKHAHAKSAWLRLHLEPAQFTLELEDDGQGLQAEAEKKGRSGLRNMRKRMQEIGGKFEVTPRPQGGTIIKLIAPLG